MRTDSASFALSTQLWREVDFTPIFPPGWTETLGALIANGARIGIIARPGSGKTTLQFGIHACLDVESTIILPRERLSPYTKLGKAMIHGTDSDAPLPATRCAIVSWYELQECGHLWRLFSGAKAICSRDAELTLSKHWLRGAGGTYTIPDSTKPLTRAWYNLHQCFPIIAQLTTHVVSIRRPTPNEIAYELFSIARSPLI